ncbi:MAG: PCRF domain-containing protein, partial [Candidatus Taylorbacteria bacterium]|nr:PCRF domain-containing protein [Candidatus Taylorbacteria bacterium]
MEELIYKYKGDLDDLKQNHKTSFFAYEYERLMKQHEEVLEMMKDPSMKELAEEEVKTVVAQIQGIEEKISQIIKEDEAADEFPSEVILEVRAGAGGEEAALFAEQLAGMYQKYAAMTGWSMKQVDSSESALGGFKLAARARGSAPRHVGAAAAVAVGRAGAADAVGGGRAGRGLVGARLAGCPAHCAADAVAVAVGGASAAHPVGGFVAGRRLVLVAGAWCCAVKDVVAHAVLVGRAAQAHSVCGGGAVRVLRVA